MAPSVFTFSAVVVVALYSLLRCSPVQGQLLPVVINTWPFVNANYKGVVVYTCGCMCSDVIT